MSSVRFQITDLSASVPEGIPIEWRGREIPSGALTMELDQGAGPSSGTLDYSQRKAKAEFRIKLRFSEFADLMQSLGMDPELGRPIRAVLRSEGDILDDHSFALSGHCEVAPHALFADGDAVASVLPGH